jgi:hypothetical protein
VLNPSPSRGIQRFNAQPPALAFLERSNPTRSAPRTGSRNLACLYITSIYLDGTYRCVSHGHPAAAYHRSRPKQNPSPTDLKIHIASL